MPSMWDSLWGRITGADINKTFPQQQGQALDRVSDMFIAYPYGLYGNLPDGQLFKVIDSEGRVVMGLTVERIADVAQNEVTVFHPITNSKIHFKNNGDIDIDTLTDVGVDSTQGNINITNKNLNITCTENVVINCINATTTATVSDNVNAPTANINTVTTNVISTAVTNGVAPITNITSTTAVNIISPLTTITGDLTVTGNTILGPSLIAGGLEHVGHTHLAGIPPGSTGPNQ